MKKTYTQPAVDVEMLMVENGIAVSEGADNSVFGFDGEAGQESGYLTTDFEL